ncbi:MULTISPECIES: YcbK family protein [Aeromonas]|nr:MULTISPECIES: DUF882 domain-containing protein [Aeromonas]
MASISTPLTAASGFALPKNYASKSEAEAFWTMPRTLKLHRPDSGDEVTACYWRDGELDKHGYQEICQLMRDVRFNEAHDIDIRLLNLLRGGMGWLSLNYGIDTPFVITSGYRTKAHNDRLEGAAKNSAHLKGQAVDGYIKGIPVEFIGRLFAAFQGGGVGFYLKQNFVHVDVAGIRYWVRGAGQSKK